MKKLLLIVAVLAIAATWGFLELRKRDKTAVATSAARPTNAVVQIRNIQFTVSAAGEITPAEQVSVRPEVNGKIAELPVDLGDKVLKGTLLFRLDDEDLKIERTTKVTAIDRARLELERTQRNLERSKKLFDDKLVSKELYEDTQTEYALSKNSLERTQTELSLIDDRLSKTKIVAPFDCTILTRPVSVGQAVSGSGGFNSGTEVLSIADLNELVINAHVNTSDVTRLKSGQEVDVLVEPIPGLKLKGVVERISPQASFKNSIKGYAARVVLKNVDARVRPGMTANVAIPVASAEKVLTIPIASVFSEMGERFVFVMKNGSFQKQAIQTGVSDYEFVEVKKGISEGDVVSLEQIIPEEKAPKPTGQTGTRSATAGSSSSTGTSVGKSSTTSTGSTSSSR